MKLMRVCLLFATFAFASLTCFGSVSDNDQIILKQSNPQGKIYFNNTKSVVMWLEVEDTISDKTDRLVIGKAVLAFEKNGKGIKAEVYEDTDEDDMSDILSFDVSGGDQIYVKVEKNSVTLCDPSSDDGYAFEVENTCDEVEVDGSKDSDVKVYVPHQHVADVLANNSKIRYDEKLGYVFNASDTTSTSGLICNDTLPFESGSTPPTTMPTVLSVDTKIVAANSDFFVDASTK
jgi:hypothetical protein